MSHREQLNKNGKQNGTPLASTLGYLLRLVESLTRQWILPVNTVRVLSLCQCHPHSTSSQEYKAKKREKLLSRISDQLKQGVADAKASLGASQDLTQTLSAMSNRAAGAKSKGSRFTQIEKLQFAKVCDSL